VNPRILGIGLETKIRGFESGSEGKFCWILPCWRWVLVQFGGRKQASCIVFHHEWLIGYLTARQHRKVNVCHHCVPTAGEGNRLSWLRMANEIQSIIPHVTQCNTDCSKTLQLHKRNNRQSNRMTYLPIITLALSPIPSQIPHTLFDIYNFNRCGCSLTLCPCKTVHNWTSNCAPTHEVGFRHDKKTI